MTSFMKDLPHSRECAIEMATFCNYHCEFCSGPRMKKLVRRGRSDEDINKVIDFFSKSKDTWLIGLSGGEPTIHPGFERIVESLIKDHFFYFFTNLSCDVDWLMGVAPPDRVSFIKASLHPEANIDEFMSKFDKLHRAGYNPILIMVSLPDRFPLMESVAEICRSRGYHYTYSVLEGPYQNKNYPNDYTSSEFLSIEKNTIEPGNLIRLHKKTPGGMNTFGMKCIAGSTSFQLDMESGEFFYCESVRKSAGNIYDGEFLPNETLCKCPAINGCVGYDRYIRLPLGYEGFFSRTMEGYAIDDPRLNPGYPASLRAFNDSSTNSADRVVDAALEFIQTSTQGKKTVLWGAGIYGAKVYYRLLQKFGHSGTNHIVSFADSLRDRREKPVLGLPVISPKEIGTNSVNCILITSFAFEDDIMEKAAEMYPDVECIPLHRKLSEIHGVGGGIF